LYLTGKAEASPEGNPELRKTALAYQVFSREEVDPFAIEADRTFLGLLTFKWVINAQYKQFTCLQTGLNKLSRASFDKLHAYTLQVIATDEDLEFCLYTLACNDLGKTLFLVAQHKTLTRYPAVDHDQLLYYLVNEEPWLFSGFQAWLTSEQQSRYIKGLRANFNLGQFFQGESFTVNLVDIQAMDVKSRELRLVCELFDFAGATGHLNPRGSMVMTEDNYQKFNVAIEELMTEPLPGSYQRYITRRGTMVGLNATTPEDYAKCRIATLSRASLPTQGVDIQRVWEELDDDKKRVLTEELNLTGFGTKGILLYYAPALLANTIRTKGNYVDGLKCALDIFVQIYRKTRQCELEPTGDGVITVNVEKEARQVQLTQNVSTPAPPLVWRFAHSRTTMTHRIATPDVPVLDSRSYTQLRLE
jgi:hypothetical protein